MIGANAQTKALTEVEVDLGSGTFSGTTGLPFDVPFKITGPVTPNLRAVWVRYKIKDDEFKKWMRFPSSVKKTWSDTSKHWTYYDEAPSGAKFHLFVGPLHPNVTYEFQYFIEKIPSLTATQKDDLKKAMFNSLVNFLEELTNVDDGRIATLNNELNTKLQLAIGKGEIQNLDRTPFKLDVKTGNVRPITDKVINCNLTILKAKTSLTRNVGAFAEDKAEFSTFKNILDGINQDKIKLNAASLAIWNAPITNAVPALKDLKFSVLAQMFIASGQNWADLINGKLKIDPPNLTPVTTVDNASFTILTAFFEMIANGKLVKRDDSKDAFAAIHDFVAGNLLPAAKTTVENQNIITDQQQAKVNLLASFPDILADKIISLSIVILDKSVSDVVSSSSPYIGLDYGLSYTPKYTQLFIYEGVNFYFVPVNKDARLSTMTGFWNNLSKRLSVHLGLTQSLIAAQNKNYVPLIGNVGSILLGGGLRFSRILRLNYGTIFFYEKDANPLKDKQTFKAMYTFSLTFDFNVAKAFGDLGTRLGIKN